VVPGILVVCQEGAVDGLSESFLLLSREGLVVPTLPAMELIPHAPSRIVQAGLIVPAIRLLVEFDGLDREVLRNVQAQRLTGTRHRRDL
jgi:hypothetical protein